MIVGACKYLLRRPKAREDSCFDGEQSVPPRSAPAIGARCDRLDRRGRYPEGASKEGGQDRVRTLSAAAPSSSQRRTPVSSLYTLANDKPTVSSLTA